MACPPEDIGGAYGYEEFLQALADPEREQHEEIADWAGGSFDPKKANPERIVERFARLAKKWAPQAARPKAVSLHRKPRPTPDGYNEVFYNQLGLLRTVGLATHD